MPSFPYEALKAVLPKLPLRHRLILSTYNGPIQTANKAVPYRVQTFGLGENCIHVNGIEWSFKADGDGAKIEISDQGTSLFTYKSSLKPSEVFNKVINFFVKTRIIIENELTLNPTSDDCKLQFNGKLCAEMNLKIELGGLGTFQKVKNNFDGEWTMTAINYDDLKMAMGEKLIATSTQLFLSVDDEKSESEEFLNDFHALPHKKLAIHTPDLPHLDYDTVFDFIDKWLLEGRPLGFEFATPFPYESAEMIINYLDNRFKGKCVRSEFPDSQSPKELIIPMEHDLAMTIVPDLIDYNDWVLMIEVINYSANSSVDQLAVDVEIPKTELATKNSENL